MRAKNGVEPSHEPGGASVLASPDSCPLGERVKSVNLSAGCDLLFCQGRQESLQFPFTGQISRKLFAIVTITPEPGAVTLLGVKDKMPAANDSRRPLKVHLEYSSTPF